MAILCSPSGWAAIVTTTADNGPGSLRQAIASAAPGETITFVVSGVITLTSGELVIDRDLTILGPGANNLMIQRSLAPGTPDFRILRVLFGTATLSGLTVNHGRSDHGGGLLNESSAVVLMHDVILSGNSATNAGGGLFNDGVLGLEDSAFIGNFVQAIDGNGGYGGGIANWGSIDWLDRCLFRSNSVTGGPGGGGGFGGAINNSGFILSMDGCALQGNWATGSPGSGNGFGGGINNDFGTLTLTNCTLTSNSAIGGTGSGTGLGGGINNEFGTVYVDASTVRGNFARGGSGSEGGLAEGGGVANGSGTVELNRSTVNGNLAAGGDGDRGGSGAGGGVANDNGTVFLENSTVSGNVVAGGAGTVASGSAAGGGLFNSLGATSVTHSTIAANTVSGNAAPEGGGIFNSEGFLEIENTIVAANTGTSDLFNGLLAHADSIGHNVFGSLNTPIVPGTNDQFNVTAAMLHLGPLQDNGGPTFTHALLCGSPAIDAGQNLGAPPMDQRGFPRVVNGVIDIGAFEADNTPPTIACPGAITLECSPASGATGTVSVNVADADGDGLVVMWTVDGLVVQTNFVAAGGPPTAARVDLTANFAVGGQVITVTVIDSEGCSASCSTTLIVPFRGDLYPIALSIRTLAGASVGSILPDIYNGVQPGNFGWLTWAGSPNEPTLATSLRPPGNSENYTNPNDPEDHVVSVGDWAQGSPGISNSGHVRDALDRLEQIDITVPVWDQARATGNNSLYRVTAFARVRLISYQLPRQNRITARFLGFVDCP